jgi:LDH2 family malate/lactate/ureidoglycolate dehydrogenase
VPSDPPRFPQPRLRAFAEDVLRRAGASADDAATVADCLIDADRRGIETHGLVRLPAYWAQARSGEVAPDARPRIERERGPTALVDGARAFGAVVGVFAIGEAAARAERYGVGVVSARRSTHFGAASYYALRAAGRGLIGIVATNTPAVMAPWGGAEARLGNNPLSVAAPMPAGLPPFAFDIAQSASSRGRLKLAELNGERLPEGWALDAAGAPTTDPAAALEGVLLPFGGHKGSGLALAVEVLTGALSGSDLSPELVNTGLTGASRRTSATRRGTVGNLYAAIDPAFFTGRDAFLERMGLLAGLIHGTPPQGPAEVLLPGEPEARAAEAAGAQGIRLDAVVVPVLQELGEAAGVAFPPAGG